ncbi:MAG: hypothetical protein WC760_09725 [Bacteroidia bacterium]|jgi:hypothetical protein
MTTKKNTADSKKNFEITKLKSYQRKIKTKQVEQQTLLKETKKPKKK